jgi:transcriptional regulator with XRE-family HTH domain
MYLIRNLKFLMQGNVTYKSLAKETKINIKTIITWFSRKQLKPSTPNLKKLSDYFQTSIDYLLMEDLTKLTKKEIISNYNLIQKRLQHG